MSIRLLVCETISDRRFDLEFVRMFFHHNEFEFKQNKNNPQKFKKSSPRIKKTRLKTINLWHPIESPTFLNCPFVPADGLHKSMPFFRGVDTCEKNGVELI
ncbi:hypothetical protein NPIL_667531 [Nephila pilipes]|uniref:Uncharacterized protein n=1 Tax=Nephila pilipes TaxID=299642 RepID=A0A8X6TEC2_NEPPI|nr:hypothetical protein NPIL_667531 [Nephila pilipes]